MATISPDTRPEAEWVQIELLSQFPPWRTVEVVGQMSKKVRTRALNGLHQRHPQATQDELQRRPVELLLGTDLATGVRGPVARQEQTYSARTWEDAG